MKDKHVIIGKDRVSLRVLISREDYEVLRKIAEQERNEISSLIRRAIARFYLVTGEDDTQKKSSGYGDVNHGER
jgi:hypothetical protein